MKIPPVKVVFDENDRKEIWGRIEDCLTTGMLTQGKYVSEFEERWADYVGAKYAVAVSSGSSAIEIGMRILDVAGKEVLVPANTFASTATGVLFAGGRVSLVDADASTFSVSLDGLKRKRTSETVGIIVVHIGGIITPQIEAIRKWCDDNNLWLFEDCAHAHGSEIYGKRAGTFGVAGAYSFFATKVMTTAEGGMVVTDDEEFAKKARLLRNHGKPEPWVSYHTEMGGNWRMSELNAAVGLTHLRRLDEFIAWRDRIARVYTAVLSNTPGITLVLPQGRTSWYKYIVLLPPAKDRGKVKERMAEKGVRLSGEVYEIPLNMQPVFKSTPEESLPVVADICARHICLPLYYGMSSEEASFVANALIQTLEEV
jgi:dTDP-4-amino-4,6-dideoxygalactose transaminase